MDIEFAISGLVKCLRDNVTDPETRASATYWIDDEWIDERLREHDWPQISIFEVGSGSTEARRGYQIYFPTFQIDVFASSSRQKNNLVKTVKNVLLEDYRDTLNSSGIKIDGLTGESDVIEDERMPLKTWRKTMIFAGVFHSSG